VPSLRHAHAVVILALAGMASLPPVARAQTGRTTTIVLASDIGGRGVVAQAYADPARRRVDRTIVTPFDPARRIIARPDGLESAAPPRAAAPVPAPASAPTIRPAAATVPAIPPAADRFVDIGVLDLTAPAPPRPVPQSGIVATEPFVAAPGVATPGVVAPGAFVHIGSYDGSSTISPD